MAGKAITSISIGYLFTVLCATSLEELRIHRQRESNSNNVTLLCENESAHLFISNAEFWRNSTYKITNFTYGSHNFFVNASATISLTPQDEGNYSCRDPKKGITSTNHIVLLAYPVERPNSQYSYEAQLGQNTKISCPFPRGALGRFYSHHWSRGFRVLTAGDRYVLNEVTFELTILNTSFGDNTTGPEDSYTCQVGIVPPPGNGNSWSKSSRPISLLVINETRGPQSDVVGVSTVLSTLAPSPSPTLIINHASEDRVDTDIVAIVVGIIIASLIVAIIFVVGVVCFSLGRRKIANRKNSVDMDSTAGNYDEERSHASTARLSDADTRPRVSDYALKCLSNMSNGNPQSPPLSMQLHGTTPNNGRRISAEMSSQGCSEHRTANTVNSYCSSLYMKALEPTSDYAASGDVEFVGSIQVIDCDRQGGEYNNKEHAIKVRISRESFNRDGTNRESIELEIGVAIHGHFKFPDDWRPVSPILWLHTAEDFSYEFGKYIDVELPHFLQLGRKEETASMSKAQQLGWMFAYSNPDETHLEPIELVLGDARFCHFLQRSGKVHTKRGCYMCLCGRQTVVRNHSTYCLVSVQKPVSQSSEQNIFLFVCYHLNTFLEVIKEELKSLGNFSQHQFVFTSDTSESLEEAKIAISLGTKSASKGWQLTIHSDTPEISAKAVELWEDDVSDLRLRRQRKRYPPRVKIVATHGSKAQNTHEIFTISGARFLDRDRKKATIQVPLVVN